MTGSKANFSNGQDYQHSTEAAVNRIATGRPDLTPDGLQRLRAAALRNRPWLKSTGPRTPEGKRICSRNASKGGHCALLRSMALARVEMKKLLKSGQITDGEE